MRRQWWRVQCAHRTNQMKIMNPINRLKWNTPTTNLQLNERKKKTNNNEFMFSINLWIFNKENNELMQILENWRMREQLNVYIVQGTTENTVLSSRQAHRRSCRNYVKFTNEKIESTEHWTVYSTRSNIGIGCSCTGEQETLLPACQFAAWKNHKERKCVGRFGCSSFTFFVRHINLLCNETICHSILDSHFSRA